MEQGSAFLIYRSSAGSGKTYNLAREYLKLALSKPGNFRHILAVTFTNKATREMKSRILAELYNLSNPEISSPMVNDLMELTGLNRLQLQERSLHALRSILHDFSHFSVSTIDSFFRRVIQGFEREIGLQGGYEIELDTKKVLGTITDMMFRDLAEDKKLLDWLFRFTNARMEEEKGWDIRKEIIGLGEQIFRESFSNLEEKLRSVKADSDLVGHLRDELSAVKFSFEKEMKKLAGEALEIIQQNGLSIEDFSFGKAGVAGYFSGIVSQRKYEYGKRVADALEKAEAWATKSSPVKDQIIALAEKQLIEKLKEVTGYYDRNKFSYNSASELYKYLYTFGLLTTLAGKMGAYRDENGVILISDLSLFLKEIIGNNEAPFIYEKAGIFFDHFLIDEFQDTSRIQWQNFAPLVKDSIAQGRMNLVVGDVKQSIYRWRGGDWTLLDHEVEKDIGREYVKMFNLTRNWRSRENIIRFNNLFFSESVNRLCRFLEAGLPENNPALKEEIVFFRHAYSDIIQELPETGKKLAGGHVEIRFLTPGSDKSDDEPRGYKTEVLKRIPELFERAGDSGIPAGDIAIIVRNNREGMEVARYMLEFAGSPQAKKGYHYEVISSESLVLGSSDSVNVIVNALRFINDRSDDLARINLVHYYRKLFSPEEPVSLHDSFTSGGRTGEDANEWKNIFPGKFIEKLPFYPGMPLDELTGTLITDLKLSSVKGEYPYLLGFEDALDDYLVKSRNDVTGFLGWWEEEGSVKSISMPDSRDAARILTIHKSKGLEFRMVIIPFCNWKMETDARKENILWVDASKTCQGFDIPMPVKYSKALEESFYAPDYYHEKLMSFIDNLNLLYVAFTRAVESLVVLAPAPGKPEKEISPDSADKLMFNFFRELQNTEGGPEDLVQYWDEEQFNFHYGELSTMQGAHDHQSTFELETLDTHEWQPRISFRRHADNVFIPDKSSTRASLNRGVIIHEILSEIIVKEDLDKALQQAVYTGLTGPEDSAEIKELILALLNKRELSDWFSGDWKVKTEVPVIPAPGELSRMDRVMFRGKEVVVLDYKTGVPRPEDKKQVRDYMNILQQMDYNEVSGYLLYTAEGKLEKV